MDVTKPYKFIGFGAMDVTKPYKFIGFGRSTDANVQDQEDEALQEDRGRRGLGP